MPTRDMLINYVPGEECRIAVVQDGRLDEFYQERAGQETHVGNIYKGVVSNVEPAIQAAFVDFGLDRNGFLHISDLHPKYFPGQSDETELVGQKTPRRERPPIQKCLRRGQEILVQVLKEGIGTKGPTLTSYLSIPGRYLVMMPDMERLGVSRKVEDDEARREMRQLLDELKPPQGFGFIIRTAGIGRNKTEIKRDLAYLTRLWKSLETRMAGSGRIGELYTESDLLIRTLRDVFSAEIQRIMIDDPVAARRTQDFFSIISPRSGPKVYHYRDPVPMFHRYDIERQIENINARTVPLPSGGSLVFDQAEALVAIDVNSGKSRDNRDAETTAYKTNLEAADEICRQLRLRDLGGVIVNDLIDMISLPHRRAVEQRFKTNLKNDRSRTKASGISMFGILEMTRQRMRPSLTKNTTIECVHCHGQGQIKSAETVVLEVLRRLTLAMLMKDVARIELTVSPDVAFQLLNRKRRLLVDLESRQGKPVMVRVNSGGTIDFIDVVGFDARGVQVAANWQPFSGEPQLELVESGDLPLMDEAPAEPQEPVAGEKSAPRHHSSVDQVLSQAIEDGGMSLETSGASAQPLNASSSASDGHRGGRRGRGRGRGRRAASSESPSVSPQASGMVPAISSAAMTSGVRPPAAMPQSREVYPEQYGLPASPPPVAPAARYSNNPIMRPAMPRSAGGPPVAPPSRPLPPQAWRSSMERPEPGNEAPPVPAFDPNLIPDDIGNRIDRPIPSRSAGRGSAHPANAGKPNNQRRPAGSTRRGSRGGRGRGGQGGQGGRGGQGGHSGQGGQGGAMMGHPSHANHAGHPAHASRVPQSRSVGGAAGGAAGGAGGAIGGGGRATV